LAWILAKGEDIVPIPGTKRRKYLEQNAAAAGIDLSAAEVKRIEAEIPSGAFAGPRYPEEMMKLVDKTR
jgi:aryl-alcohol dehydrogenase-like predicted oxidoreductase